MSNNPHITIVSDDAGDWSAVYLDGKQFTEGHSVRYDELLDKLQEIGLLTYEEKDGTAAMTGYSFPDKLEDVQYDPDYKEDY